MREDRHHQYAQHQHGQGIERRRRAAEYHQHMQAGQQNQRHRGPYPGEKLAEHAGPQGQPLRRLQYAGSHRAQCHIGEEHAANPDDDAQDMQKQGQGHGHGVSFQNRVA